MASQPPLTHLFAELSSLEDLKIPLKGSTRLRYTCMSVSQQYIALGSNTGCVYVFGRDSLKHVKSVYGDNDSKPVTVVAISPNELNVALAVSSGQVIVMEMNIERRSKPERLRHITDHQGAMVTAMVWGPAGSSLFVGDSLGKVTQISVPSSMAKTIFTQPSQTIVRLECSIIQLDWWDSKLLASSLSRAYLLNTAKQQFSQIGNKPREGEFGACFFLEPSSNYPVIYCARPGSRMWEVDFEGNVLNTHQFKQLLATQAMPIVTAGVDFSQASLVDPPGPQSVSFLRMFRIREFILTWSSRGLYIFDPINVRVVLWTDSITSATIRDLCVVKNELYIFLESQQVRRLLFLPVLHLCAALVTSHRCLLAAELVLYLDHFAVKPSLLKHIKKELLPQLVVLLKETGHGDLVESIQAMMEDVSESSLDSVVLPDEVTDGSLFPVYTTQTSGIVVVNDGSTGFGDTERRGRWSNRSSPVDFLSHLHNESRMTSPENVMDKSELKSNASVSVTSEAERNNNQQSEMKAASVSTSDTSSKETSAGNFSLRDTLHDTNESLCISTSSVTDTSLKEAYDASSGEISVKDSSTKDISDTSKSDISDASVRDANNTSLMDASDALVKGSSTTMDTFTRDTSHTLVRKQSDTLTRDTSQNTPNISYGDTSITNIFHTSEGNCPLSKSEEEGTAYYETSVRSKEVSNLECSDDFSIQYSNDTGNSEKDTPSDVRNSMLSTFPRPTAQPGDQEDEVYTEVALISDPQAVGKDEVTASLTSPSETVSFTYSSPSSVCHSADNKDETESKPLCKSSSQHVTLGQAEEPEEWKEIALNSVEAVSNADVSATQKRDQLVPHSKKEGSAGLRKINSMPLMMTEEEEIDQTGSSGRKVNDAEPLIWSPMDSVQRNSSGSSSDQVTKTSKKKKKRVVNEVDIPLAGSLSGQRQRSESADAMRQKMKKKDLLPRAGSLDSSIDHAHHNDNLQQPASESESVSLATISSIKEEENTGVLTDDVFVTTTLSRKDVNAAMKVSASNPELFVTSAAASEEERSSDISFSSSYEHPSSQPKPYDQDGEVIPPLIERLSALGVSKVTVPAGEEASVKNIITVASKQKIASVKERVTKFSSTTRSLIRRVTEKNPLVSRSPSESPPSASSIHSLLSHSTSPKDYTDIGSNSSVLFMDSLAPSFHKTNPSTSTCCISLDPFLCLTEETQKQITEYSILLNPGELKAVLDTWAAQLNHTLYTFHKEHYRQQRLMYAGKRLEEETAVSARLGSGHAHSAMPNPKKDVPESSHLDLDLSNLTPGPASQEESGKTTSTISSSCQSDDRLVSHPVDSFVLTDNRSHHCESNSGSPGRPDVMQNNCESHLDLNPVSTLLSGGRDLSSKSEDHEQISTPENSLNSEHRNIPDSSEGRESETSNNSIVHSPIGSGPSEKSDLRVEQKSPKPVSNKNPDDYIMQKSTDNDETSDYAKENYLSEDDKFCCDWSQVCHVKDPFQLTAQQHKLVSSLAWRCIECGCFGNASDKFSTSLTGPKTVCAKHQVSEAVPSSYGSFSDSDCSCLAASADTLIHQKPDTFHSSESQSLHLQTQESRSNTASASKESETGAEMVSENVTQKDGVSVCNSLQHSSELEKSSDCQHHNHQHPSHCQNNSGASEMEVGDRERVDQERALFVRLYFHFLPYWRLRRLLLEADGKVVYATWCAFIACCQALGYGDIVSMKINNKDITGAMDYLRSGILPNKQAFMGHVASLFGLRPTLMTEFSAEVPHQVRLADVLHLCHLHAVPQHQVVTRYLTLRLGATPSHGRCELLRQICTTQHTKLAVLDCLIHLHFAYISSPFSSTSISSDVRLKASADNSRLTPEAVSESLAYILSLVQRHESGKALETCWQHSYWSGCLQLLKQTDQWQRALELEVKLNDITLINGQSPFGFTPRNLEEWKCLLHLYTQSAALSPAPHHQSQVAAASSLCLSSKPASLSSSFPSPVSEEIKEDSEDGFTGLLVDSGSASKNQLSWMSLGLLAAQHLGPKIAVDLLRSCLSDGTSDVCFPAEFYNTCLTLTALERKQKLVVHNMLDKVDSYLWAKKPVHITPQVYYAATQERSALQSTSHEDAHSYHNLFARLSATLMTEKQLAEDPDCHWGVKVNIQTVCQVCQMLVTDTVSHLQPGVFTFKCGHVFHKFCVPDKLCPLC